MRTLPLRFWEKVDRSGGPDACWVWTAHRDKKGYGKYGDKRPDGSFRTRLAHRVSAEASGLDMGGLIHHACEQPACVNPFHLEAIPDRAEHSKIHDPGARQLAKTHCPAGHPYLGENLRINSVGGRECRVCRNAQHQAWRKRRRAEAA